MGGPQRHTCFVGGARSGKTVLLLRALIIRALRGELSRHAILRFRANAVISSIVLGTFPWVMRNCFPGVPYMNHRRDGFFEFPNKSEIWYGGLDENERIEKLLGNEFVTILLNECSQIPYSSIVVARTRCAQTIPGLKQRMWYDLNPTSTSHWTNMEFGKGKDPLTGKDLRNPEEFARLFMNPKDNEENLDEGYLESLENLPGKHKIRFFDGKYVDEIEGALWSIELLEQCRDETIDYETIKSELTVIAVAVDPSGAKGSEDKRSGEIGIVVAGMRRDGKAVVLADATVRDGPEIWGKVAVNAYERFEGDCVVGETNYGGDMVRFVIHAADKKVPFKKVTASRGKHVRAEPISSLYHKDMVIHAGRFVQLEEQLTQFSTEKYMGEKSPDRADALVWCLSYLFFGEQAPEMPSLAVAQIAAGARPEM